MRCKTGIITLLLCMSYGCSSVYDHRSVEYDGEKMDATGEVTAVSVRLSYVKFTSSAWASSAVNDSIRKYVTDGMNDGDELMEKIYAARDEYVSEKNSHENTSEAHGEEDDEDVMSSWYYSSHVSCPYARGSLVSLDMSRESNFYGTYDENKRYMTWDVERSAPLRAEDVFTDTDRAREIITAAFVESAGLSEDVSLSQQGIMTHDGLLPLTDEFIMNDEGMVFLYEREKLMPYVSGGYETVFVPLSLTEEFYKRP